VTSTARSGGGGGGGASTNAEIMLTNPNPNEQADNSFFVLSETGAVEAIASAVPSDSIDALKIRFFSISVTSTCQALASAMLKHLYNICI